VILAVGTKHQAIITRMALDIKERHVVVQGIKCLTTIFGLHGPS